MRICVIIPAYNEAKTIGKILKDLQRLKLDVIVIDDGSTDATWRIARENSATIIKNERNLGKGASLIKGFDYILKNNYDAVITMDADGQHLSSDIPNFISSAENPLSGIIIGNRMSARKNMPLLRVATNKFMSWLISRLAKQKIPDSQCGMRLIKRAVLEKIKLDTSNFETESEILIKAGQLKFKIESVPIVSVYESDKSHINPFIDTLRFFKFIFKKY